MNQSLFQDIGLYRDGIARLPTILTLQRDDFNCLVHIKNCEDEDRSYHFLRLGMETILVANWYRSGAIVHDGFAKLHDEIRNYYQDISIVHATNCNGVCTSMEIILIEA